MSALVSVAQSTLAGAGLGLFVHTHVRRGARITEYVGELIDRDEALRRRQSVPRRDSHIRSIGGGLYADAAVMVADRDGAGLGGFANDACGATPSGRHNNASMVRVWDRRCARYRVFLRALVPLSPGDEVFVSYGRDYWLT